MMLKDLFRFTESRQVGTKGIKMFYATRRADGVMGLRKPQTLIEENTQIRLKRIASIQAEEECFRSSLKVRNLAKIALTITLRGSTSTPRVLNQAWREL